jgi:sporulation protein YlmC with PRC-barrel domain
MLQSLKQLYGKELAATDASLGQVKDFYFDDQNWAVRYVIVDTAKWLPGRHVLLSPQAFGQLSLAGKAIAVNLTRVKIEGSPPIEAHKPVSRQYEDDYHRYYGWPSYWENEGLLGGLHKFPILETPPKTASGQSAATIDRANTHLRSTQAVSGYHIMATDGITGHVCDFMMDPESWVIHQLIVKTGHRFTGKEVQIPVNLVERISYTESTVFVNLTRQAIENSLEHLLISEAKVEPSTFTL